MFKLNFLLQIADASQLVYTNLYTNLDISQKKNFKRTYNALSYIHCFYVLFGGPGTSMKIQPR